MFFVVLMSVSKNNKYKGYILVYNSSFSKKNEKLSFLKL